MAGNLTIPNVFAGLGGQQAASLLDQDFNAIRDYINPREITVGTLGARPAPGLSGRWYFATDDAGGTLYVDTGTAWVRVGITVPAVGYRVLGLKGTNNATTPDTQFNLSADLVQLRNPADGTTVVLANTGTLTNNIAVQGANGRDQAAAFGASSWIHFYFIWNGTTLATLSSLSAPPTGPTLPSGYTHWGYAIPIRYNATPVLVRSYARGAWVHYQSPPTVLSNGTATTETAVSVSTVVPPNALAYSISQGGSIGARIVGDSSGTAIGLAVIRITSGNNWGYVVTFNDNVALGNGINKAAATMILPNIGQQFIYLWGISNGTLADGLSLQVDSYKVPNGGE
jgi:hypothetical protein